MAGVLAALALAAAAPAAERGPSSPRIINGTEVGAVEYAARWQSIVAVGTAGVAPVNGQFCGGVLIDPVLVLTAAHCVTDDRGRVRVASQIDIHDGSPDLNAMGAPIRASEIYVHPSYSPSLLRYDVAVIRLSQASAQPTMDLVQPGEDAQLWGNGGGRAPATEAGGAWLAGWGNTNPNPFSSDLDYPDVLREINIPVWSDGVCASWDSWFHVGSMLCAGKPDSDGRLGLPSDGKDACYGDSGGPLIAADGAGGPFRVIGTVSLGTGCGGPQTAFYGRVASMRDWIESIQAAGGGPDGVEAPLNPSVPAQTMTSLTLDWDPPGGLGPVPSSYRIYRVLHARYPGHYEYLTATSTTDGRQLVGLMPGTTYNMRIRSVGPSGTSGPVAVVGTTLPDTRDPSRPGTPALLGRGDDRLYFRWSRARDNHRILRYRVYLAREGARFRGVKLVGSASRQTTISGLRAGTRYRVAVQAQDMSGNWGPRSNAMSVSTRMES